MRKLPDHRFIKLMILDREQDPPQWTTSIAFVARRDPDIDRALMELQTQLKRHRDDVRMVAEHDGDVHLVDEPGEIVSLVDAAVSARFGGWSVNVAEAEGNTHIRNLRTAQVDLSRRMSAMESVLGRIEATLGHIVRPADPPQPIDGDRVVAAMRTVEDAMRPKAASGAESAAREALALVGITDPSPDQVAAFAATTRYSRNATESLIGNEIDESTSPPVTPRDAPRVNDPVPDSVVGNVTTRSMGVGARGVKTVIEEVGRDGHRSAPMPTVGDSLYSHGKYRSDIE